MSGGHFDYDQHRIGYIADSIEKEIENSGREKTEEELRHDRWGSVADYYEKYPEAKFHYKYPDEVIEKFKIAVIKLREAQVYAHRIDWLISGDDGDETFIERLSKDLSKL